MKLNESGFLIIAISFVVVLGIVLLEIALMYNSGDSLMKRHLSEKAGSGILDMIALCRQAGLPEPEFRKSGGQFVQILWRDWLTEALMDQLDLDERQRKALAHLGVKGRITSSDYQSLTGASRQTASRDLADLVKKGLIARRGERRGTFYVKTPGMPRK